MATHRTPRFARWFVLCWATAGTTGCAAPFLGKWVEVGERERPWDTPRKEWTTLEFDRDGSGRFQARTGTSDCASLGGGYSVELELDEDAVSVGQTLLNVLWPHRVDAKLTVRADGIEAAAASGFFLATALDAPDAKQLVQTLNCSVGSEDIFCYHGRGSLDDDTGAYDTTDDEPAFDAYGCRSFFRPDKIDDYQLEFYYDEGPEGTLCPPDSRNKKLLSSADLSCVSRGDRGEESPGYSGRLVSIPAGSFDMGCTPEFPQCWDDEEPVMPVTLTHDYRIGETEVTQAEYEAVMGSNPSFFNTCGPDCPVEGVTWHMAVAFANALSEAEGLTACYTCEGSGDFVECEVAMSPYDCDGYRLPTEAEWEKAARCGEAHIYPGSDNPLEVGWIGENSGEVSHPVSQKAPNACGLYDLLGNVEEWIHDRYDSEYYISSGRTDPEGGDYGSTRVSRGVNFYWDAQHLALRYKKNSDTRFEAGGFRLAQTVH